MTARILIVEDAESTRKAMRIMLSLQKHEVIGEAENGREAVMMYQQLRPDLVLMDVAMPEMHGIDATKEILAFDPKARIIIVTALYSEKKRREVLDAGALDIVIKPFDVETLMDAITNVLMAPGPIPAGGA